MKWAWIREAAALAAGYVGCVIKLAPGCCCSAVGRILILPDFGPPVAGDNRLCLDRILGDSHRQPFASSRIMAEPATFPLHFLSTRDGMRRPVHERRFLGGFNQ